MDINLDDGGWQGCPTDEEVGRHGARGSLFWNLQYTAKGCGLSILKSLSQHSRYSTIGGTHPRSENAALSI